MVRGVAPADQAFDLNRPDLIRNGDSRDRLPDSPTGAWQPVHHHRGRHERLGLQHRHCVQQGPGLHEDATAVCRTPDDPAHLEDVTCAFTNERLPSLTVSKETSPSGSHSRLRIHHVTGA